MGKANIQVSGNEVTEIPEVDAHTEITVNAERKDGGLVYSWVKTESFEDKKRAYNALTTDKQIGDYLNEVIEVVDIIAGDVFITNKETGEVDEATRTVLILADGSAVAATSSVLFSRLMQIVSIFGNPNTWPEPLKIKVRQQNLANGRRIYVPEII